MSFPNSKLKENLELLCLESHFDIIETGKLNIGRRATYNKKIY